MCPPTPEGRPLLSKPNKPFIGGYSYCVTFNPSHDICIISWWGLLNLQSPLIVRSIFIARISPSTLFLITVIAAARSIVSRREAKNTITKDSPGFFFLRSASLGSCLVLSIDVGRWGGVIIVCVIIVLGNRCTEPTVEGVTIRVPPVTFLQPPRSLRSARWHVRGPCGTFAVCELCVPVSSQRWRLGEVSTPRWHVQCQLWQLAATPSWLACGAKKDEFLNLLRLRASFCHPGLKTTVTYAKRWCCSAQNCNEDATLMSANVNVG